MNILYKLLIFFFFISSNCSCHNSLNDKFYSFMESIINSSYMLFLNEEYKNQYERKNIENNSELITVSVNEINPYKRNIPDISIRIPMNNIISLFRDPKRMIRLEYEEKIESFLEEIMKKLYELNLKRSVLLKIENVLISCNSDLCNEKNNKRFKYYKHKIDYYSQIFLSIKLDVDALEKELKFYLGREIPFSKVKYKEVILFWQNNFPSKILEVEKINNQEFHLYNKYNVLLSIISPVIFIPCQSNKKIFFNLEFNPFNIIKFYNLKSKARLLKIRNNFKFLEISYSLDSQKRNIQHKINMIGIKKDQLKSYRKIIKNRDNKDLNKVLIDVKLSYLEDYINYFYDVIDLFGQIVLYKRNNGDLIHNYRQIIIRRAHDR